MNAKKYMFSQNAFLEQIAHEQPINLTEYISIALHAPWGVVGVPLLSSANTLHMFFPRAPFQLLSHL